MDNRVLAKQFKDNKQYDEAAILFKKLWEYENSHWDGWNYAHCLYYQNLLNTAYEVSKQIYEKEPWFLYNRNLLVRIINDKFFRTAKDDYSSIEIDELFNYVDYIFELLPDDKKTQIEFSVFRTIKLAKKYSNKMPQERILKALSYLDINLVSDKPYTFELKGREKEIQSNKEAYYSYKTKALLAINEYEACIECCDEACEKISKFHHDNDIWLMERKMQSIAALGDIDAAIEKSRKLVLLKNNWFLKYSLAKLLLNKGLNDEALIYFLRAAASHDPIEMKVNLLVQIGDLLADPELKTMHYLLAESIRIEKDWSIPIELSKRLNDIQRQKINSRDLEKIWIKKIQQYYGTHTGLVDQINDKTHTGFIKCGVDTFYFKFNSVVNGKIQINEIVNFVVIESWDLKKNKEAKEAAYIFIQKNH